MMKTKAFILLMTLSFLNCNDNNYYHYQNNKYLKMKSFYPNRFVDHFPPKISSVDTVFSMVAVYSKSNESVGFKLSIKNKNYKIEEFVDSVKNLSKQIIEGKDTCVLVLNRFHTKKNRFIKHMLTNSEKEIIKQQCYLDKYPIPNFYDCQYTSNKTDYSLPEDFVVFVLDAKSGKYWEDKYLYGGYYMPEEWEHGYSKGIAISKKRNVAIYWFVIW